MKAYILYSDRIAPFQKKLISIYTVNHTFSDFITTLFPDYFVRMDAKLLQLVETIQDESTKQVVSTIISELKKTQSEVSVLFKNIKDFCSELEMRVREQERYTSKDSIIIDNPPFVPNVDDDALLELIVFFFIKKFLRYELEPSKIKACHILPGRAEEKGLMASVIAKFL